MELKYPLDSEMCVKFNNVRIFELIFADKKWTDKLNTIFWDRRPGHKTQWSIRALPEYDECFTCKTT